MMARSDEGAELLRRINIADLIRNERLPMGPGPAIMETRDFEEILARAAAEADESDSLGIGTIFDIGKGIFDVGKTLFGGK